MTDDAKSTNVVCPLCPHSCHIAEAALGWCKARTAHDGHVMPAHYGHMSSLALDPIEKKPLAFFYPGSMILSVGGFGCNLDCPFCQNSSIAHGWNEDGKALLHHLGSSSPVEKLVALAKHEIPQGNIGIAYTYNEPSIDYEFVRDCAQRAHEENLLNVIVTNAYLNKKPWEELLPHLDAANIDLKGFTQKFYDLVNAPHGLETVKRNIEVAAQHLHVEVTTLIIPGLNDSPEEITALAQWLASINSRIPLHLTRFFPQHRMRNRVPTPLKTLQKLRDIAQQSLSNVLLGNI